MQQFGYSRLCGFVNVDQQPHRKISKQYFHERRRYIMTERLSHHTTAIRQYFGPEITCDAATLHWMICERMKTPTATHVSAFENSSHADFRPFLPTLQIPSQIYWSRYGSIKADEAVQLKQLIPQCETFFFETCGHLIPWIESEKFNAALLAFADKVIGA
jgi:pimeloyl-ACP methyl ester carboxylesterase